MDYDVLWDPFLTRISVALRKTTSKPLNEPTIRSNPDRVGKHAEGQREIAEPRRVNVEQKYDGEHPQAAEV
jgi:hypothetical protein